MIKYASVKKDTKPLWFWRGDHIPAALMGIPFKVIDESSKTYVLKFNDDYIFEVRKYDIEEVRTLEND